MNRALTHCVSLLVLLALVPAASRAGEPPAPEARVDASPIGAPSLP